jgi:hypothetical protein
MSKLTPAQELFAWVRQNILKIEDNKTRETALLWLPINRRYARNLERVDLADHKTLTLVTEEIVRSIGGQISTFAIAVHGATGHPVETIIEQLSAMIAQKIESGFQRKRNQDDAKSKLH